MYCAESALDLAYPKSSLHVARTYVCLIGGKPMVDARRQDNQVVLDSRHRRQHQQPLSTEPGSSNTAAPTYEPSPARCAPTGPRGRARQSSRARP